MTEKTGTIVDVENSELQEDGSATNVKYQNPARLAVLRGDKVNYIEIIARTPNGNEILNIIKERKA